MVEKGVTGQQMCELILKHWQETDRAVPGMTPEHIWNYSSTGELSSVFIWYEEAKEYFRRKNG